jgi:hypothetical protein
MGYKAWEKLFDPTDVIKFGKRVNYETRMTSDQVMEDHLRQMNENMNIKKQQKEFKRR